MCMGVGIGVLPPPPIMGKGFGDCQLFLGSKILITENLLSTSIILLVLCSVDYIKMLNVSAIKAPPPNYFNNMTFFTAKITSYPQAEL